MPFYSLSWLPIFFVVDCCCCCCCWRCCFYFRCYLVGWCTHFTALLRTSFVSINLCRIGVRVCVFVCTTITALLGSLREIVCVVLLIFAIANVLWQRSTKRMLCQPFKGHHFSADILLCANKLKLDEFCEWWSQKERRIRRRINMQRKKSRSGIETTRNNAVKLPCVIWIATQSQCHWNHIFSRYRFNCGCSQRKPHKSHCNISSKWA